MLFGEKRAENVRQLLSSQERIPNIYTHAHANTHTNTVGRASVEYVRESFFGGEGVCMWKRQCWEFWSLRARQGNSSGFGLLKKF